MVYFLGQSLSRKRVHSQRHSFLWRIFISHPCLLPARIRNTLKIKRNCRTNKWATFLPEFFVEEAKCHLPPPLEWEEARNGGKEILYKSARTWRINANILAQKSAPEGWLFFENPLYLRKICSLQHSLAHIECNSLSTFRIWNLRWEGGVAPLSPWNGGKETSARRKKYNTIQHKPTTKP